MWSVAHEPEIVVAVARDENEAVIVGVLQRRCVRRRSRKHVAQPIDMVAKMFEEIAQLVGNVVVEEKIQGSPGDICRATNTSISPR